MICTLFWIGLVSQINGVCSWMNRTESNEKRVFWEKCRAAIDLQPYFYYISPKSDQIFELPFTLQIVEVPHQWTARANILSRKCVMRLMFLFIFLRRNREMWSLCLTVSYLFTFFYGCNVVSGKQIAKIPTQRRVTVQLRSYFFYSYILW